MEFKPTDRPFKGPLASPEEFIEVLDSPQKIQNYYQASLGRPLDESMVVTQFTRRVLAYLHGNYPGAFMRYKPTVFQPGVPEFVALGSLVGLMLRTNWLEIDLISLFKDRYDLIPNNRVVAGALSNPGQFATGDEVVESGALMCECIGLVDTCRRTQNQIQSTGLLLSPVETVDPDLGERVYDYITNIYPIVGSMTGEAQ